MSSAVEIRHAILGDFPAIAAIAEAAFRDTYRDILSPEQLEYDLQRAYSPKALQDSLQKEGHTYVTALQAGQVVGFASFSPLAERPERIYLHKLYLDLSRKGQGLGRRLLDFVVGESRRQGYQAVELTVNRRNSAAEFYRKAGFQIEEALDIPIGNGYWRNDYRMALALALPSG